MNRMGGITNGDWKDSKIWCIVGVAVYQVHLWVSKSCQNDGARRAGMTIALPARSGDRNEARRPWTWKRGMIAMVRSLAVSSYVMQMLSAGWLTANRTKMWGWITNRDTQISVAQRYLLPGELLFFRID